MTTMVDLACYTNGLVDGSQVTVYTTLTRYVDPANNSDKYRRFISVCFPGKLPYVFTHTGRWTHLTAAGNWNGGTYRPGKLISQAFWNRNGRNHMDVHVAHVLAKKGDYAIHGVHALSSITERWTRHALQNTEVNGRKLLGAATGVATPPQPAPQRITPANPVPQRVTMGPMDDRISSLIARAQHDGVDPFDLFEDIAILRKDVAFEKAKVLKWEADLLLANEQIMARI